MTVHDQCTINNIETLILSLKCKRIHLKPPEQSLMKLLVAYYIYILQCCTEYM